VRCFGTFEAWPILFAQQFPHVKNGFKQSILLLLLFNEVFPERVFQYLFTERIVILKLKFLFIAFI
jgi:hypothetical protein